MMTLDVMARYLAALSILGLARAALTAGEFGGHRQAPRGARDRSGRSRPKIKNPADERSGAHGLTDSRLRRPSASPFGTVGPVAPSPPICLRPPTFSRRRYPLSRVTPPCARRLVITVLSRTWFLAGLPFALRVRARRPPIKRGGQPACHSERR